MVILVYIYSKTSYFRHVLSFQYPFDIISISKSCSRFHEEQGDSFFSNLPWGDKTVRKPSSALSGHGSTTCDPTNLVHVFFDFLMFYQSFFSPKVKRRVIISNKHDIYELPHKFLNDLRLRIFEKIRKI